MSGRFEILWYEDLEGNYIPHDSNHLGRPEGAQIQVSRFPFELTTNYLMLAEDGRSTKLASARSGYSSDLLFALARPSARERLRQVFRYGWFAPTYDPKLSVFLAAATCERCTNTLAHRHGLSWGYSVDSDEWHLCGTSCQRCEHLGRGKFWVRTATGDPEHPYSWSLNERGRAASARKGQAFLAKHWPAFLAKRGKTSVEEAQWDRDSVDPDDEEE